MIAAFALVSASAQAELLKTSPTANNISGVTIASGATMTTEAGKQELGTLGAGLRSKYKLFKWWPVYVGQLMMEGADKFVREESKALSSTDGAKALAMQMTFVRTVGAADLAAGFREGLVANEANFQDPAIVEFLKAVNNMGEAESGKTIVIAGERVAAAEIVYVEGNDGKAAKISGGAGFVNKIFSLWLGATDDGGVETLKKDIISGRMK